MQNDDEAPLSIISAGGGLSVKKASEYDQEIPQSHTADQPTAPREEEPQKTNSHKTSGRQLK